MAEPAAFDPFAGVVPPPPPPPPAPVAAPVVVAPTPPPPVQDYRFLGHVKGPDGGEQILLARGDATVSVEPGTKLDNGYVVESITGDSIVLTYPSFSTKVLIQIHPGMSAP